MSINSYRVIGINNHRNLSSSIYNPIISTNTNITCLDQSTSNNKPNNPIITINKLTTPIIARYLKLSKKSDIYWIFDIIDCYGELVIVVYVIWCDYWWEFYVIVGEDC